MSLYELIGCTYMTRAVQIAATSSPMLTYCLSAAIEMPRYKTKKLQLFVKEFSGGITIVILQEIPLLSM